MSITLRIKGMDSLTTRLKPSKRARAIKRGMDAAGWYLVGWVKDKRLSGPRPRFLSGVSWNLRTSITSNRTVKRGNVFSTKIGTNVKSTGGFNYPAFWEGAAPYDSGRHIAPRPFLRPALEDLKNHRLVVDTIKDKIQLALRSVR